ncbi:S1C family serine protease [Halalkalibacter krulwichiae]|uniref:Putative periplasmic serine endoprotease DegP-like n=1 Tax=Halalkalibacter krulwichiae TaxID=199441 RepID=A0A1X9MFV9_9BACI|nr:trypsin-like peptidase domain-containing protein [Halalkalibacter krulwichiae]ARK32296.1 putative periplasmic serine endoprotease DegP-like precursor [Halalkalibacter krulwichiae]
MKKQWIISSLLTVFIWGAGAYAFFSIKDDVPSQLNTESMLLASAPLEGEDPSAERELKEIIDETQKLVVHIELEDDSLGSGFLYNDQGDVVTNAHVVGNATEVQVKTTDNREFSGTVIGLSETIDVALVRVDGLKGTESLNMRKKKRAEVGDEVLAIGSPLGYQNTVTTGIVSGLERAFEVPPYHYEDMYQISAPIAPGNSGGPLIDRKTGEVLGINSAAADQGSIGFSIPMPNVITLIEGWSKEPMTTLPVLDFTSNSVEYEYDTNLDEDYAQFLVSYFYESLDQQDYVTAYSLLGSSWQGNLPYEDFREGYIDTKAVSIEELTVNSSEEITVVAIITAQERTDDGDTFSQYRVTYTIGYENDQMKILSGWGEELE